MFERLLQTARFYRLAVREFRKANIEIDNEVKDEDLQLYDQYLHEKVLPGTDPDSITALSGDGIEKILVKVGVDNAPKKRAGRPP